MNNLGACSENISCVAAYFSLARPLREIGERLMAQNGVRVQCNIQDTRAMMRRAKIKDFARKATKYTFSSLTELCLRFF